VEAGLVDGSRLHLDGSLINAHASRDSVVKSSPELIVALKAAYQVEERKLEGNLGAPHYQPVNATLVSTTDPDAPCVRQSKQGAAGDSRPRYKQHRAVDDRCGVVTAVVTTPGDVPEPTQTEALVEQHEHTTGRTVATVIGDQQYGTTDNHRRMQERGVRTHLKTVTGRPADPTRFTPADFAYDEASDRCRCPAGQWLYPRGYNPSRQYTEYKTRKGVCSVCPLRQQCTGSTHGRVVQRYRAHELVLRARHGRQLRSGGQLPWLQTLTLAPAVASADPGLAHRSLPQCEVAGQGAAPGTTGRCRPGRIRSDRAIRLHQERILRAQRQNRPTLRFRADPVAATQLNQRLGNTPSRRDVIGSAD
jgi:hypothetical protein